MGLEQIDVENISLFQGADKPVIMPHKWIHSSGVVQLCCVYHSGCVWEGERDETKPRVRVGILGWDG